MTATTTTGAGDGLAWPVFDTGEGGSVKVVALINLPPQGNTTHAVRDMPSDPPFRMGHTACGLGFGMGVRVRPYPAGGSPEMAGHLQEHPLCATCAALLTPPPVIMTLPEDPADAARKQAGGGRMSDTHTDGRERLEFVDLHGAFGIMLDGEATGCAVSGIYDAFVIRGTLYALPARLWYAGLPPALHRYEGGGIWIAMVPSMRITSMVRP